MRILWVKAGGLWPLTSGGRIRSFHTVDELSRRHAVTVLTTHGDEEEAAGLRARLRRCEVRSLPYAPGKRGSSEFASAVMRSWASPLPADLWRWRAPALRHAADAALHSGDYDLCVADFLSAVPNLPNPAPVPVLLFEHNVEHLIWRRLSASVPRLQRAAVALEWRKLRRYERRACTRATTTVAVSEDDRARLAALAPGATVAAIPTGVDTAYFAPNGAGPPADAGVVFVGSMDWFPNEDAALFLLEAVLPGIRAAVPDARLTLVGRDPSERLRAAAAKAAGAEVTGTVDDVRPYLERAAVVVVPVRVGGGTRLKIFEALAMGKALVSTTVGAEGLPLVAGEHYLRADAPEAFAAAVVELLRTPGRRDELGAAGRALVTERHGWPVVARAFEQRCREAAA
jgi:glycosyltransferase involved in cell wall biosynthesis